MKTLSYYLDKAKDITGSDYRTAKVMGVTTQYVSDGRRAKGFSNEGCRKLAEITGDNVLDIIAAAEVTKHPERAKDWAKWTAAAVMLSASLIGFYPDKSMAYVKNNERPSYTLCAI